MKGLSPSSGSSGLNRLPFFHSCQTEAQLKHHNCNMNSKLKPENLSRTGAEDSQVGCLVQVGGGTRNMREMIPAWGGANSEVLSKSIWKGSLWVLLQCLQQPKQRGGLARCSVFEGASGFSGPSPTVARCNFQYCDCDGSRP